MWFAAILGTATKYAECMLAIKYREVKADGTILGGPFYTIEKGMGNNWKWLAVLFAIFGTLVGLLGIGTFTQVNGITGAVQNAFDPQKTSIAFSLFGNDYTWATVISGAIITVCVALVIIGGLKRIAKVAEKIVPAMAFIYIFLGLSVLIMNATKIPGAFALIFKRIVKSLLFALAVQLFIRRCGRICTDDLNNDSVGNVNTVYLFICEYYKEKYIFILHTAVADGILLTHKGLALVHQILSVENSFL